MARLVDGVDAEGIPTRFALATSLGLPTANEEQDAHPARRDLARALAIPATAEEADATFPAEDAVQAVNTALANHTPTFDDSPGVQTISWTFPDWLPATTYKVEKRVLRYQQGTTTVDMATEWATLAASISTTSYLDEDLGSSPEYTHAEYRVTPMMRLGNAQPATKAVENVAPYLCIEFTGAITRNTSLGYYEFNPNIQIPSHWLADGGPGYLRHALIYRADSIITSRRGRVQLGLATTQLGTFGSAGPDFTDDLESGLRIIWSKGANSVTIIGTGSDTTEPYAWVPSNAAAVGAFANTLADGNMVTLMLCGPNLPDAEITALDWVRSAEPTPGANITYRATPTLGVHDEVDYAWSVTSDPMSYITLSAQDQETATVVISADAPDDYEYELRLVVTARGTGTNARTGTMDNESLERTETVVIPPPNAVINELDWRASGTPIVGRTVRYSVDQDALAGIYDEIDFAWTVTDTGGHLTISGADSEVLSVEVAVGTPANYRYQVRLTATARGTGDEAASGSMDSRFVERSQTVLGQLPVASINISSWQATGVPIAGDSFTIAIVLGGTYDTADVVWSVRNDDTGGSSLRGTSTAGATVDIPSTAPNGSGFTIQAVATGSGTGVNVRSGTTDSDTRFESYTVRVPQAIPDAYASPTLTPTYATNLGARVGLTVAAVQIPGGDYSTVESVDWQVRTGSSWRDLIPNDSGFIFLGSSAGNSVDVRMRGVNGNGQPGDWSPISTATVPEIKTGNLTNKITSLDEDESHTYIVENANGEISLSLVLGVGSVNGLTYSGADITQATAVRVDLLVDGKITDFDDLTLNVVVPVAPLSFSLVAATFGSGWAFSPSANRYRYNVRFNPSVSGGTPPYIYNPPLPQVGFYIQGVSAAANGFYAGGTLTQSVTVSDSAGSSVTRSTSFNVPARAADPVALPLSFGISGSGVGWTTISDGSWRYVIDFSGSASGGTPPYTYSPPQNALGRTVWRRFAGNEAGGSLTHSVTVTDSAGTSRTASATVTYPART